MTVGDSDWNCTLEPTGAGSPVLRLGLRLVKRLTRAGAERLLAARKDRPFDSNRELAERTGLGRRDLEALAAADALQPLGVHHRLAH